MGAENFITDNRVYNRQQLGVVILPASETRVLRERYGEAILRINRVRFQGLRSNTQIQKVNVKAQRDTE
jgi:hypothetical protein